MALVDRVASDLDTVFMNHDHFATWHTWNGIAFQCITDEETALKRKNNNVMDISWDNNTMETMIYVRKEDLPGRALPNEHIIFDNRPMRILQIQDDMGMYTILLVSNETKAVAL